MTKRSSAPWKSSASTSSMWALTTSYSTMNLLQGPHRTQCEARTHTPGRATKEGNHGMKHTIIHIDLATHHDIDVTEPPAPAFHSFIGRLDALLEQWAFLYDVEDWKITVTKEERDI